MSSTFVRLVVVFLGSLVFVPPPQAIASPQEPVACPGLPANIQSDPYLVPALAELIARSPTFRRQLATVAAARHVHVTFTTVAGARLSTAPRARATITRFAHGMIRAAVEIPMPSEYHELIPHELEHVIEQIEGLNLARLAEADGGRVMTVGDSLFETTRAQKVGRTVAAEMLSERDPAVARATRLWRTLSSRAVRTRGTHGRNR